MLRILYSDSFVLNQIKNLHVEIPNMPVGFCYLPSTVRVSIGFLSRCTEPQSNVEGFHEETRNQRD